MKLLVVLTQYKRNHLEAQLIQIKKQTIKPDYLVVFQNENHVDITQLKEKYDFIHIKSEYNTKYFGRFSICFNFPVDLCIVMDDDIIPGIKCIENYTNQLFITNNIIGGNGRIGYNNTNKSSLVAPPDIGIRKNNVKVDFVGHLWCFKKDWLYYMFGIKPFTYDTSEDMHLCYSCKVLGNIDSMTCKQTTINEMCDISLNKLANDEHSSYKTTNVELRINVEKYFIDNYNLKLIDDN